MSLNDVNIVNMAIIQSIFDNDEMVKRDSRGIIFVANDDNSMCSHQI
jgi:hypothetical protein